MISPFRFGPFQLAVPLIALAPLTGCVSQPVRCARQLENAVSVASVTAPRSQVDSLVAKAQLLMMKPHWGLALQVSSPTLIRGASRSSNPCMLGMCHHFVELAIVREEKGEESTITVEALCGYSSSAGANYTDEALSRRKRNQFFLELTQGGSFDCDRDSGAVLPRLAATP